MKTLFSFNPDTKGAGISVLPAGMGWARLDVAGLGPQLDWARWAGLQRVRRHWNWILIGYLSMVWLFGDMFT